MGGWLGDKLEEVEDFATDPAVIVTVAIAYVTGGVSVGTTSGAVTFSASAAMSSAVAATAMLATQRALTPSLEDRLSYSVDEMGQLGTQVQFRSPTAIREVVYGTVTKSGPIIAIESTTSTKNAISNTEYSDTSGSEMLHHVIVLACHPIGGLEEIWINNVNGILGYDLSTTPATKYEYFSDAGKSGLIAATDSTSNGTNTLGQLGADSEDLSALVEWKINFGDGGNTVSGSDLTSNEPAKATSWRFDGGDNFWFPPRTISGGTPDYAKANGLAILHVICKYNADKFPQVPVIRATIKGRRLYDPRSSSQYKQPANTSAGEEANSNPALCVLDFLTDRHYGMGVSYSEIDIDSFKTAANTCDVYITGTQRRYTCNGIISLNKTPKVIIEELLSSCNGKLIYSNGKFKILVQDNVSTSVATINYDDIVSDIKINATNNMREQVNQVRASYIDFNSSFSQVNDISVVSDDEFLGEDLLERRSIALSLPFTNNSGVAQRLAYSTLYKMRKQATVQFECAMNRFDLDIGDVVTLNLPKYGFDTKLFEVVEWSFNTANMTVNLTFREYTTQHFSSAPYQQATVLTEIYYNRETSKNIANSGGITLTADREIEVNLFSSSDYRDSTLPKRLIFAQDFELWRDSRTTSVASPASYDLKPLWTISDNLAGDFLHIHVLGNLYGAHGGKGGSDWNISSVSNFGGGDGGVGGAIFLYADTGNTPVRIINDGRLWAGGGGGGAGGQGGGFIINADGIPRTGTQGGDGKEGMGYNLKQFATEDFSTWEDDTTNNVGDAASTSTTTSGFGTTGVGGDGGKSGSWGRDGFTGETGDEVSFSGPYTPSNPPAGYTVIAPSSGNPGGKSGHIVVDSNGYMPSNVTIVNRGSMKGRITDSVTGDEYFDT